MLDCGVLQWPCFWDQFVAAVDSTDLPDDSNFSYIRVSLKGEHKAAICFAGSHTLFDTSGIDGDKFRVILNLPILNRLRRELRLEWSRDGKGDESDLKFSLPYPEKYIQWSEGCKFFYSRWSLVLSFLWKNDIRKSLPHVLNRLLPLWSPVKPTLSVEKVMIPLRNV